MMVKSNMIAFMDKAIDKYWYPTSQPWFSGKDVGTGILAGSEDPHAALTSLWIGNNGSLHALHFMDVHDVTPKEMIEQVEASNAAIRPLLKERGVDITFELDVRVPQEVIDAWIKQCSCCPNCHGCPCAGVQAGGMCDNMNGQFCHCDTD